MATEGRKSGGSSKGAGAKKPAPGAKAKSKAAPKAKTAKRPTRKSKTKAKSKTTSVDRPLPGVELARGWVGGTVEGLGSESLGRVAGILVDSTDELPRWVVVRLGPLAGCTALPAEHVAEGVPGRLFAAYSRDDVRAAPRFRAGEALASSDEVDLCSHWQIDRERGRAAEIVDRGPSDLTALPLDGADHGSDPAG